MNRNHARIPLAVEVQYRTAGAFLIAYSTNLSKGGMFVEAPEPLPPEGTVLTLKFAVPDMGPIEVHAVVAWLRPASPETPAGMGVEFEQLEARHGHLIDHIVAGFRGITVLILSGNPQTRAVFGRAVKSILSNAELVEAKDADQAEAALKQEPDLAIIDLDDGEADGLLTLRLAKHNAHPLPVVATGRQQRARIRARELGADEVLGASPSQQEIHTAVVRSMARPSRVK